MLRDHIQPLLQATVGDMRNTQFPLSRNEQATEASSKADDELDYVSNLHALDRLSLGFDMLEVMSEYRALRASVLRLWNAADPAPHERDVHDIASFNDSIDQSLAQAVTSYTERVDQARDMFLAILGHDLRSPLGAITMSSYVLPRLLKNNDQVKVIECNNRIATSAQVMHQMISDLLDYTRTRLGAGMPVTPLVMDLSVLCREIVEEFSAAHPERDIRYTVSGNFVGRCDSARIRQAVSNLIGNAIQHGSKESPVDISLTSSSSSLCIDIHNSGDPIPPNQLERIFQPLVRGSGSDVPIENRPGSIGLGLYIAREVARSHGGKLTVISTDESGTTFTINLPRDTAPTEGAPILDVEHIETM